MTSRTTRRFRNAFTELPPNIKRQARATYKIFKQNPSHPSLRFKQVHQIKPIYAVRVGLHYRAVGVREGREMIWFWIGSHAEYDKLIAQF